MTARSPKKPQQLFAAGDVEVLSHAVSLLPDLELAAFATKLAKERLKFPVKSMKEMDPLFNRQGALPKKIAGRKITKVQLRKFFPKVFFPIQDPTDFLGKAVAAISWGERQHHAERAVNEPVRFHRYLPPAVLNVEK